MKEYIVRFSHNSTITTALMEASSLEDAREKIKKSDWYKSMTEDEKKFITMTDCSNIIKL